MDAQRLDKLIASDGARSRKEAGLLIRRGRVLVNGAAVTAPDHKVAFGDAVTVDGVSVRNQKHLYLMLNKPQGVVCATRDNTCPTVLDLLPPEFARRGLFPAGRLDKDTEGFVLLTDDGDFAHRILSPRNHVPKTYHAQLDHAPNFAVLQDAFVRGVTLDGGDVCAPARLALLEDGPAPLVEVVIHEGMYHQIKRMFSQFSLEVLHLRRVKIGGLPLDPDLPSGQAREIMHKELALIS